MKTINTYFTSSSDLEQLHKSLNLSGVKSILVQLFLNERELEVILEIRDDVCELFSTAKIIGTTTDGVIHETDVTTTQNLITISLFYKTQVKTYFQENIVTNNNVDSYLSGQQLAANIDTAASAKVAILFSDGLHTNGDELLKGFTSCNDEIIVSGGMAGDGANFSDTYVFSDNALSSSGITMAVFYSDSLHVYNSYSYHWQKIGREMCITKSKNNIVYTIDNRPAAEVYSHYLGQDVYDALPGVGIEFPLVVEREGIETSRAILGKRKNDALVFSGNLFEGDKVHFAVGNAEMILETAKSIEVSLNNVALESVFIYSCMARRRFLQEVISHELLPFASRVKTSGFFSYGEFYTAQGSPAILLNQTMTILGLSESEQFTIPRHKIMQTEVGASAKTQKALANLINVTSSEVQTLNKELEKRVHEKTKALEKSLLDLQLASKVKSQFLANMSHEIRTPLNAIIGFLDILRRGESDNKRLEKFDIIKSSSKTLLEVINDILDLTKLESGKFSIEKRSFNMEVLLHDIVNLFEAKANEKNVYLKKSFTALAESFLSDSVRIKQILSNLLSNAIKFTQPMGEITISTLVSPDKKLFHITISDTGCGIAQENLETIFESFSQEDYSTTRKYGGTGLGLHISKQLALLLEGSINVTSEKDVGSSFTLTLPYVEGSSEVVSKVEKTVTTATLYDVHALIVEDNKSNQMLLKILLEDFGISCSIANDGLEGVRSYKKEAFDIIFMDENMPNMSGVEALHEILAFEKQELQKHTPVIAVTANALEGDSKRLLAEGFDAFMSKPINFSLLSEILKKYLH